jgi:tetratricopeptide (TPR) repeat protein
LEYKNHFKEKLSRLIFLEIQKGFLEDSLQVPGLKQMKEDLFLPLSPEYIAENITQDMTKNLPFGEFVKGMYYVAGADPEFAQVPLYRRILLSLRREEVIKGYVAKLLKEDKKEDALLYLLGLYTIHQEADVLLKALSLLEEMAITQTMYQDALKSYAELAQKADLKEGNLFLGSAWRLQGNFDKALLHLREYLRQGGEETPEITEELEFLDRKTRILEGEGILYENPQHFLELVLPLLNREEDNPRLLLMIGIAYRLLKNHEKAVYYLQEALAVDEAYVDVHNELGINYAALGDYALAITYFRKIFEQVRSIEILTNLIMCYLNVGDLDSAKAHIEIAELMDGDDEILQEIKQYVRKLEGETE